MNGKPEKALLLAAGKGTRLRPHTDHMPKPMVAVGGRSIIMRSLDKLAAEGVGEVVINLHHLADVLERHLAGRTDPHIVFSKEDELLETGGGAKKALPLFGDDPFYMINGDALWEDGPDGTALSRLARLWDDARMDILLLLQPVDGMTLTGGVGDYHMDSDGHCTRALNRDGAYMFAGIRIAHPRVFKDTPEGAFSFLELMDRAQAQGRLYGLVHTGAWHHISTPEDLAAVDAAYRAAAK